MNAAAMPMASPNLLKRPFAHIEVAREGGGLHEDTNHIQRHPEHKEAPQSLDPPHPQLLEQHQLMKAKGPHSSFAAIVAPAAENANTPAASATSSEKTTSKRQKLIAAAQETKRQEKEIKDRQRTEEKAKKDGEKEEKRKIREAQLKAKEDEKIQRDKVCSSI